MFWQKNFWILVLDNFGRSKIFPPSLVTKDPDSYENDAKKAIEEELDATATTMAGGGKKMVLLLSIFLAFLGNGAV